MFADLLLTVLHLDDNLYNFYYNLYMAMRQTERIHYFNYMIFALESLRNALPSVPGKDIAFLIKYFKEMKELDEPLPYDSETRRLLLTLFERLRNRHR